MEGEQPKIRTMAKDLESVKREAELASTKDRPKLSIDKGEAIKRAQAQIPQPSHAKQTPKEAITPTPAKPVSKTIEEAMMRLKTASPATEVPQAKTEQMPNISQDKNTEAVPYPQKLARQAPTPPPIRQQPQRPAPSPKEEAKQPMGVFGPRRTQVSDIRELETSEPEKTLADILNEARTRIDIGKSERVSSPQAQISRPRPNVYPQPETVKEKSLDELLPIEEAPAPKTAPVPPVDLPFEEPVKPEFKLEKPTQPQPAPRAFPDIKPGFNQSEVKAEPMPAKKETPEEILGIKPSRAPEAIRKPESISSKTPLPIESQGPMSNAPGKGMLTPDEIAELAQKIPSRKPPEEPRQRSSGLDLAAERTRKPAESSSQETEIEKLLEEREKTRKERPGLLRILAVFLLVISLGGGAYFAYLKFLKKEVEEPLPLQPKPPIEVILPQAPKPLLAVDSTVTLKVQQLNYEEILPQLENLKNSASPERSITYIPILLHNDEVARFISISEFFTLMKMQAPPTLNAYDNYSLYLYHQAKTDQELCLANGMPEKTCHGPRLGLVIDLSSRESASIEEEKGEALKALVIWEATTMVQDLSSFILAPVPASRPPSFLSGRYNNTPTRYINLPIHTTSIDWLIEDKYLIIATSMDAARTAVDRLGIK